jgi:hypothetical protein
VGAEKAAGLVGRGRAAGDARPGLDEGSRAPAWRRTSRGCRRRQLASRVDGGRKRGHGRCVVDVEHDGPHAGVEYLQRSTPVNEGSTK